MKAVLLAAGFGTRLRPITDKIPKCMVPIMGKPLLEIWLENLSSAKVGPFLINTHYLASQVTDFVESSKYKKNVTISFEPELLGTAGTLLSNLNFFEEQDGLFIHADNYCLTDFKEFINAHNQRPSGCLMTMMTFRTDNPSACGIVELDQDGIVVGFHEKVDNPPSNLANGAIYILSAEMLQLMKTTFSGVSDFSNEVLKHLMGKIYTYYTDDVLMDIGTIANYKKANKHVNVGEKR